MQRWRIYFQERFPLVQNSVLVAVFSFCAVSFSARLRGDFPEPGAALIAFVACFLTLLHLRLADEFKDAEEDRRYRPYRPVPRGLIRLRDLRNLWFATGVVQFVWVFVYRPELTLLLLLTWAYLTLMSVEFFARRWLKARPVVYLLSHMIIMPLIDLFATACDWLPAGGAPSGALWLFLSASFTNGILLEIGRKIRLPKQEEKGVETYSFLWGRSRALVVWIIAIAVTGALATGAGMAVGVGLPLGILAVVLVALASLLSYRLAKRPSLELQRLVEPLSGLVTLSLYGALGILSLFV